MKDLEIAVLKVAIARINLERAKIELGTKDYVFGSDDALLVLNAMIQEKLTDK